MSSVHEDLSALSKATLSLLKAHNRIIATARLAKVDKATLTGLKNQRTSVDKLLSKTKVGLKNPNLTLELYLELKSEFLRF